MPKWTYQVFSWKNPKWQMRLYKKLLTIWVIWWKSMWKIFVFLFFFCWLAQLNVGLNGWSAWYLIYWRHYFLRFLEEKLMGNRFFQRILNCVFSWRALSNSFNLKIQLKITLIPEISCSNNPHRKIFLDLFPSLFTQKNLNLQPIFK